MDHITRLAAATPATRKDLDDASSAPSIASSIHVSPSRDATRGVCDRIRTLTGGDAAEFVGPRGLAVVREFGLAGVEAIGWSMKGAARTASDDAAPDLTLGSNDLDDPSYDLRATPTSHFAWDARGLALAAIGQVVLDGVMRGDEWSLRDTGEAHLWSQDVEQLLKVGPLDDDDAALLAHAQTLAELAGVELHALSALLRAAFAIVDSSTIAAAIREALSVPAEMFDPALLAPAKVFDFAVASERSLTSKPARLTRSKAPLPLAATPPQPSLFG